MADKKQELEDALERLTRRNREQEQASYKLAQAMDTLSNTALNKLQEAIKKQAKDLGILNDEQLELIKTSRDLTDVLEQQEKKAGDAKKAQEKYNKTIGIAQKLEGKNAEFAAKIRKRAEDALEIEADKLKLSKEQVKALAENTEKFKKLAEQTGNSAKSLDSFTKHIDTSRDSLKSWVAQNVSVIAGMRLIGKGLKQGYDEFVKLTNVGLQGTLVEVNTQAMRLKMSFDEMSDLISKNRDVINSLGGGSKGIQEFANMIDETSSNLSYMGKDAQKATGRFANTLKLMGTSAKDGKTWKTTMYAMQNSFKENQRLYGDSADVYAGLIESQFSESNVQSRLIGLGKQQASVVQNEIIERTKNLKALGMSNDQIVEFTKRLEEMNDPMKMDIGKSINEAVKMSSAIKMLGKDNPALKVYNGMLDKWISATSSGNADEKRRIEESKEFSDMMRETENSLSALGRGAGGVYRMQVPKSMLDGNDTYLAHQKMGKVGAMTAQNGGNLNTMDPAAKAQLVNTAKATQDANDALSTSFKAARNVIETTSTAMETSLGKVIAGLALTSVGLVLFTRSLTAATVAAGMGGAGAAAKGLAGTLTGLATTLAGVAAGGYLFDGILGKFGVGKDKDGKDLTVDKEKDQENWNKMTAWEKFQSGTARGIEHVGRFANLDNMANAAQHERVSDETKYLSGRSTPVVNSQTSFSSMSAQANPLGNLLATGESGAAGYNANNRGTSNGKIMPGSTIDMSQLTIGDIMKRQALSKSDPNRLFAVGRYQMIPDTFKEAVKSLQLDSNTKFTPDVQEQMFQYLITKKRPAIGDYISGKSNDVNAAMLSASQEWASVANPQTGMSSYGSGNVASIGSNQLASTLQMMRGSNGAPVNSTVTPTGTSKFASPYASYVPTVAPAGSPAAVTTPEDTELKKQTAILQIIASNTAKTFGSGLLGKKHAEAVANNLAG